MAVRKTPGARKSLNEDELVKKLVPDPSQVPSVRCLAGFMGSSTKAGYKRLYLTPELNEYVEFRTEDVVHTQSVATDRNPLGGSVVWLKRDAEIQHTRTESRDVKAEFLQGDITTAFLARARSAATFDWRGLGAFRLAAGSFVCTLDSYCITSVDTDPFCPKLTSPISTSKCACPAAF